MVLGTAATALGTGAHALRATGLAARFGPNLSMPMGPVAQYTRLCGLPGRASINSR